jgi:cytochrome c oxidase cbb3-type subunit 4
MIGVVRGMITLSLLLSFVGLFIWAWSSRRKDLFDRMAQLPLEDDK